MPGSHQSTTRPRRRMRRDAEDNRHKILRAAQEFFAERGLDANFNDVAHHAGVGVGTLYRHFPDRESLIDELFGERVAELVAIAEEAVSHADPWEGLVRFMEDMCAKKIADRGLRELVLHNNHGRNRVARIKSHLAPLEEELVNRAKAAGYLRDDVHPTDLINLMRGVTSIGEYAKAVEPQVWRRHLAIVMDGLRSSRDKPSPLPVGPLTFEQQLQVMSTPRSR